MDRFGRGKQKMEGIIDLYHMRNETFRSEFIRPTSTGNKQIFAIFRNSGGYTSPPRDFRVPMAGTFFWRTEWVREVMCEVKELGPKRICRSVN